jgi:hypothetical protein
VKVLAPAAGEVEDKAGHSEAGHSEAGHTEGKP